MHLMHNQAFKLTTEALGLPEGIFRHPQALDGLDEHRHHRAPRR